MSNITIKEKTFELLTGVAQYTDEILFPSQGYVGVNSIQLKRTTGAHDVAIVFEVTGDGDFAPDVPYASDVDTFLSTVDKQLFAADSVPLAVRGRYKLTADGGTVELLSRTLSM